jgi:hypothetical protein
MRPESRAVCNVRAHGGADTEPQHEPGQPWCGPSLRTSCSSTSEAAKMRPSTLSGSRRAVLAVRTAQAIDVGAADRRREGGHGADHHGRHEADHPVPGRRPASLRAAVGPANAGRGRISELSRKQQG